MDERLGGRKMGVMTEKERFVCDCGNNKFYLSAEEDEACCTKCGKTWQM